MLSLEDKIRNQLKDDDKVFDLVTGSIYDQLLPLFREEAPVISNALIFISNLCYQKSKVKNFFLQNKEKLTQVISKLYAIIIYSKRRYKYQILRENAYHLIVNFLNEQEIRE